MKITHCFVLTFLVVSSISQPANAAALPLDKNDDKPKDKIQMLSRLVGSEWVIDGKWSHGDSLHARAVYSWGIAKKTIETKTYVKVDDKEYLRYSGVIVWHPKRKQMVHYSFAFNGEVGETVVDQAKDGLYRWGFVEFDEKTPAAVRSTIKFLDNDSFQWKVTIKQGEDWTQIMDGTWKRKK